ncbi:MAG TPA: SgcJ/EcaC family oxidoreductase, partial [Flavisolibacter sp.]|nr:SgcJ/EcaC family oxidoreductase [Flavisolibacter sp.]
KRTAMLVDPIKDLEAGPAKGSIQQVLKGFTEGWNEHNANIFSGVFVEDADCTNVMGDSFRGRTAIEEKHKPLFKTIWSNSTLTTIKTNIRFIKPDVAAVDACWKLEELKTSDGNECPPRNELLNFTMTKYNKGWRIAVMHNMDLPASKIQNC